jgi:hypothetical protein
LQVLPVPFAEFLAHPHQQSARVAQFLELPLNLESMAEVADPALYRRRR